MKPILTSNSALTEIVFESRNKLYGAYGLRMNYHRRLNQSLLIALLSVFALGLIAYTLNAGKGKPVTKADIFKEMPHDFNKFVIESMAPQSTSVSSMHFEKTIKPLENTYRVINSSEPINPIQTNIHTNAETNFNITDNRSGDKLSGNNGDLSSGNVSSSGSALPLPTNSTYEMVSLDTQPNFPGGIEHFYSYLSKNLRFTPGAREAKLSLQLFVTFVIGTDGKIHSIQIPTSVGYGMDEVITKILSESPAWSPRVFKGESVSTIVRLPINFKMIQ